MRYFCDNKIKKIFFPMNYTEGILFRLTPRDMFPAAERFRGFQASLRLGLFPAHHGLHC